MSTSYSPLFTSRNPSERAMRSTHGGSGALRETCQGSATGWDLPAISADEPEIISDSVWYDRVQRCIKEIDEKFPKLESLPRIPLFSHLRWNVYQLSSKLEVHIGHYWGRVDLTECPPNLVPTFRVLNKEAVVDKFLPFEQLEKTLKEANLMAEVMRFIKSRPYFTNVLVLKPQRGPMK